ncbi:flagellin [Marinobacterium sp. YM272]|uniref:flagellin N-terminal helical domain-containing protein n=1 Tax=Marinobacterium sp. YM272 TaxID=3421654 RepID=UPI003D7F20FD
MASVVNTNVMSLNAQNSLSRTNSSLQTAMERLSSGLRVNSSKDDAAGLAIANRMTSQIRGMTVAQRNANDGISLAQVAEGSMQTITDTMQRMRDLAIQSANSGAVSGGDREKLNSEFRQLSEEIKRIVENTDFNGKKVLQGSIQGSAGNFQVGANTTADNQIQVSIGNLLTASGIASVVGASFAIGDAGTLVAGASASQLVAQASTPATNGGGTTLTNGGGTTILSAVPSASALVAGASVMSYAITTSDILAAVDTIDTALGKIDSMRSDLGAVQNRFSATIDNLANAIENQSAAKSRIMDADFAVETANLSRSQILQQAGTSMLAQANQAPQSVLGLLG